jgi:predicted aspartyl protease
MGIYCKAKIKGTKEEVEVKAFLNSGSDFVVLPRSIAEKIFPNPIGEAKFMLADGSEVRRKVYEIEVEIEDYKKRRKSCKSLATIEERKDVLIGFDVKSC